MLTIIVCWIALFSVIYLVGKLFLNNRLLKFLNITEIPEWYQYFWMGFAVTLAILQIWSIFLPVNIYTFLIVVMIAGISAVISFRRGLKLPKIKLGYLAAGVILLLIISYFASLSGGWPDTLGYHLTSVKWGNESRVVPGLANLYTRLGFNSSFFLFASMLDNFFLKDRTSHVALSLLATVLIFEYFWVYIKTKSYYLKIFLLLSIPVLIEGIVRSVQISSLSYDFALLIIILAICVELINKNKLSLFDSLILSILLVTIKLSGAVFAMVVVGYIMYLNLIKRQWVSFLVLSGLFGIVSFIPYVIRNIILSGWPLYPMPVLGLNLPWSVPKDRLTDLVNVIKGWAIIGGQWRSVVGLSMTEWFPGWFLRNWERIELKIFGLAMVFFIFSLISKYITKITIKKNSGLAILILSSFLSVIYLLNFAPDVRFGGIYFWVFFAAVTPFFLTGLFKSKGTLMVITAVIALYLTVINSMPMRTDSEIMLKSVRWDQPGETHKVKVNPIDGSPAFTVNTPFDTSSCGTVELPCTSEPGNNFKEIVPGNMFGGYTPL